MAPLESPEGESDSEHSRGWKIDLMIGATVIVILVAGVIAVRVFSAIRSGLDAPALLGVRERPDYAAAVSRCQSDAGGLSAVGELTNRSSRTSSFAMSVQFFDHRGREFTDTDVRTASLEPGQTGSWSASGMTPLDGGPVSKSEPIECRVVRVDFRGE